MGEERATGENTLYNQRNCIYFGLVGISHIAASIERLHSFSADKLICVHSEASGYNNCKYDHTSEETLMFKTKTLMERY